MLEELRQENDKKNSPEQEEKAEKSRRNLSFLARIRFQAVSVRNGQLMIQASLDDD